MLMLKLRFELPAALFRQTFHLRNLEKDAPAIFSEHLPHYAALSAVTAQQSIGLTIAWVVRVLVWKLKMSTIRDNSID